jgi:hypothetical protein
MIKVLEPPVRRWHCPGCGDTHATKSFKVVTPLHTCRVTNGMTIPFVPAGTKGKVTAVLREDYVGTENVQYDADGRPVMAAVITRDEGEDRTVFAPTALGSLKE